jgi:basic amino acid/polyamine antiporter, APA family
MHQNKTKLSLLDATMLVSGSMIGSGIFIVSADISRLLGSSGWLILVWVLTALLTLCCAVSYGELSGMFPKAGGQYVYLKEAFGKLMGWLYGWGLFAVIQTGTIAAVGVAFTKFAAYFFPVLELADKNIILQLGFAKIQWAHLLSILIITLLTFINTQSVKSGALVQRFFTLAKISALLAIIIIGFGLGANIDVWDLNWHNAFQVKNLTEQIVLKTPTNIEIAGLVAAAMVGSLFSADAWNNITFIAGEVENPKRNIGLSLIIGTGIVLGLYILINFMYLSVLTLPEIAHAPSDRVAVAVAEKLLGSFGTKCLAFLIMVSTFGCLNGMILAGARVYKTMADDGVFFKAAKKLNKNEIPTNALWMQCLWASLLCLSGKYGDLLDYIVFAVLFFYIFTMIAIFKLRITQPMVDRPYKAFGYPFVPAFYIISATCISILLLVYKPQYTWPGLVIIAIGIPIYYLFLNKKKI